MGDKRRFWAFADFVRRAFPEATTVADVAGGRGILAFWLYELGMQPVIVDPRDATFPRWIHRTLRKRAIQTRRQIRIGRARKNVEDVDLGAFDLVVALHPDKATEPTLRVALSRGIDFAIVPCCVFPLDGIKRSRQAWVSYLASLAPGIQTTKLAISGANIVLWRKGNVL